MFVLSVCVCACVCAICEFTQELKYHHSIRPPRHHQYGALQAGALRLAQLGGRQLLWWEGGGTTQQ